MTKRIVPPPGPEPGYFTGGSREAGEVNVKRARQTLAKRELAYNPRGHDGERARRMVDAALDDEALPEVGARVPFLAYDGAGANLSAGWHCLVLACRYALAACRCAVGRAPRHRSGHARHAAYQHANAHANQDADAHKHTDLHPIANQYANDDNDAHADAVPDLHTDGEQDADSICDGLADEYIHDHPVPDSHGNCYKCPDAIRTFVHYDEKHDVYIRDYVVGCDADGGCSPHRDCGICDYRAEGISTD